MDFSTRLAGLIVDNDKKQNQLSVEFSIAKSTLSGYVTDHREPDFEMLVRMAAYFEVSTDYLLGVSEVKKPFLTDLTPNEGKLLEIYRCLLPDKQELLIDHAKSYYRHDKERIKKKKTD